MQLPQSVQQLFIFCSNNLSSSSHPCSYLRLTRLAYSCISLAELPCKHICHASANEKNINCQVTKEWVSYFLDEDHTQSISSSSREYEFSNRLDHIFGICKTLCADPTNKSGNVVGHMVTWILHDAARVRRVP